MDSNDPMASAIRTLGGVVAGLLGGRGLLGLDAGMWQAVIAGVIGVALTIWGIMSKRKNNIIASAATRLGPNPQEVIVTDRATAQAIPSVKVVPAP